MKRIFTLLLFSLILVGHAFADEVTFVASAPKSVVVNKSFKLEYTVNSKDAGQPVFPEFKGFEILMGPMISSYSSTRIVNGKSSSDSGTRFTYTLLPKAAGEYTIPGARIEAGGKSITSNSVTIKVLKEETGQKDMGSSATIEDGDIFIVGTVSRTKVYEDEALLLTYKLYTLHDIESINGGAVPQFDNFYSTEISYPSNLQFEIDEYKGRNYYSAVIAKYLLQPQKSGKLKIEPMNMDVVVSKTVYNQDPFSFFGGFPETIRMKKSLKSNAVEINVEALPKGAPDSFSGAVGQYSISSEISDTALVTNREATLKIILEGTGNMNFVDVPAFELPVEFDSYPPVVTDEYKLSKDSYKGKKVYEYVVTPKSSGQYTIPALEFTFFNTKTKKYETVTTRSIDVNVARASVSSTAQADAAQVNKVRGEVLATDIRHIRSGNDEPSAGSAYFFASWRYTLSYICPVVIFVLLLVLYRKNLKENANVSLVRTKKANKAAVKRLKVAARLMKQGKSHEFYEEVLKAMWGYFSDKLTIPVSELTKDNVVGELSARGVDEQQIKELKLLLDECEFARYAPGDTGTTMNDIYSLSIRVISDIENTIKK